MAKRAMKDVMNQSAQISLVSKIKAALSLDPYRSDFDELTNRINELNIRDRKRLLTLGEEALNLEEVRRVEELRVGTIKVVLTLTPESVNVIRNWILDHSSSYACEVHFTLFCFLDRLLHRPDTRKFRAEISELLEQYLLQIRSESSHAAWMAGDLLGEHWPVAESLPILAKAAVEARFVAGRVGALHGLSHALARLAPTRKRPVMALLKEVSECDVSSNVRTTARLVLGKYAI